MTNRPAKIHAQDPLFPTCAMCGLSWERVGRGGRIASDTHPPAVFNEETGSVAAANCAQCLLAIRRQAARKT